MSLAIENIDPDPSNQPNEGVEPELNKDLSDTVREEDSENKNDHSDRENTAAEKGDKVESQDSRTDRKNKRPEGVENGDEDDQNPYPDEYDPTIKK